MLEELLVQLQPLIISACITIITGVATYIGMQVKKLLTDKINEERARKIVEETCRYVNQIYKDFDGPAKFEKAKKEIVEQLNQKGIPVTELQLTIMIEAAVNGIKEGFSPSKELIETVAPIETPKKSDEEFPSLIPSYDDILGE